MSELILWALFCRSALKITWRNSSALRLDCLRLRIKSRLTRFYFLTSLFLSSLWSSASLTHLWHSDKALSNKCSHFAGQQFIQSNYRVLLSSSSFLKHLIQYKWGSIFITLWGINGSVYNMKLEFIFFILINERGRNLAFSTENNNNSCFLINSLKALKVLNQISYQTCLLHCPPLVSYKNLKPFSRDVLSDK